MKDKATKKWTELKDSGMNAGEKKAYATLGPVIKEIDGSIGVASDMVMCREKCPCVDIPAEALSTFPDTF